MVNAWSLAWEEIKGTMDETYPIKEKQLDMDLDAIAKSGGFEWTPGSPWPPTIPVPDPDGGISTTDGYEHSEYWYDYTRNDPNAKNPFIEKERNNEDNPKTYDEMVKAGYTMTGDGFWIPDEKRIAQMKHDAGEEDGA